MNTMGLGKRALEIAARVEHELQAADELGGVDDPNEYRALMFAVYDEALRRAMMCTTMFPAGRFV